MIEFYRLSFRFSLPSRERVSECETFFVVTINTEERSGGESRLEKKGSVELSESERGRKSLMWFDKALKKLLVTHSSTINYCFDELPWRCREGKRKKEPSSWALTVLPILKNKKIFYCVNSFQFLFPPWRGKKSFCWET